MTAAGAAVVPVRVNGRDRTVLEGASVGDVVADLVDDAARTGIAVAVNGEVVRRTAWGATALRAGDRVEVVTAVQGGA